MTFAIVLAVLVSMAYVFSPRLPRTGHVGIPWHPALLITVRDSTGKVLYSLDSDAIYASLQRLPDATYDAFLVPVLDSSGAHVMLLESDREDLPEVPVSYDTRVTVKAIDLPTWGDAAR